MSDSCDSIEFAPEVVGLESKVLYDSFPGAKPIMEGIRELCEYARADKRAPATIKKIASSLLQEFSVLVSSTIRRAKLDAKEDALQVLANRWGLGRKSLGAEAIHFLVRKLDISSADVATLFGITQSAISQRLKTYEKRLIADTRAVDADTPEERISALMERLYDFSMQAEIIDREVVNAIKAFLELQSKQIERDIVTRWQQVEYLSDFLFSRLLPSFQMELDRQEIPFDINPIVRNLLEEARGGLQEIVGKIKLPKKGKK